MSYLIIFVLAAFPLSSIILSVLLWKRVRYARGVATLFVILAWLVMLSFFLMAMFPLSMLIAPTIFGAGMAYLLWADKNTSKYFGPTTDIKKRIALMKGEFSKMPAKARILFLLFFLPALLLLLTGFAGFVFLAAAGVLGQNLLFVPIIMFFAATSMFIPILLLKRIKWGWYFALGVSFIDLFAFPVGTVLGIISLYLLFSSEVKGYFGI